MSVVLRDPAIPGTGGDTSQNPAQSDQIAACEELSRALDACRRQLVAALQQLQSTLRQKGDLLQLCSVLTDKVASLEITLAKANKFANYDELTGLPNRRLLLDRFIHAAAYANRHRQALALLFFDVNYFKRINDEHRHVAGDRLLHQLAARLSSSIRDSDTACRYGGDEFVVLLTDINHRKDVVTALQKIHAKLDLPYIIDGHSIQLTVSDGFAIYPNDAQRFTDLMQFADHSMFSNKSDDRGLSRAVMATSNIHLHDTE